MKEANIQGVAREVRGQGITTPKFPEISNRSKINYCINLKLDHARRHNA